MDVLVARHLMFYLIIQHKGVQLALLVKHLFKKNIHALLSPNQYVSLTYQWVKTG
jgi:hypothetical protein